MRQTFKLYYADCIGDAVNCKYPHEIEITDEAALKKAVSHDYVAVQYRNNYRNRDNFIRTNCLVLDCDNDHSENEAEWMTPEQFREAFPNVCFAVHYSRNHWQQKNGKPARPKFHCLFPIPEMTDRDKYKKMKETMQRIFPCFDANAVDSARFLFGTEDAAAEVLDGSASIADYLSDYAFEDLDFPNPQRRIPAGHRNASMSHFAGRVLIRFGDTEGAYQAFLQEAEKCDPPLEEQELNTIWNSARRFYERVKQQEGYVAPELYNAEYSYCPDDLTDVGQAEILARVYEKELRYSPATDYITYNGIYWEESKHGAQAVIHTLTKRQLQEARAALETAEKQMQSTGAMGIIISNTKKKAESLLTKEQAAAYRKYSKAREYMAFALDRRSSKNVTNTLKEARPMLAILPQELDADPYLLCTPDATFDLAKGLSGRREHRPEDFITKMTTVSPDLKGSDLWEKQLELVFCGDRDLIDYVQLVVGTACVGKVSGEQMIIAYGSGANGKSTFWNTLARVLGSYSGNMSADVLTTGTKRNVKPEMAELKGKRLVIAAELEEGNRLNTSTVKQLSSNDEIYAEKKYKDPFSFTPSHLLVLYTNHLPKVGAIDEGTWRRLIVVPFNAHIVGKSDIKNYAEHLYENAGGAILAWAIEGSRKAIALGFKYDKPKVVEEATAKYREENDWLNHFLSESCELDPSFRTQSSELYQAYRSYCSDTGDYLRSNSEFYTALDTAGFTRKRTSAANYIVGVKLKPREFTATAGFEDYLR